MPFPQPSSCGSIEAGTFAASLERTASPFRNPQVAAPLKRSSGLGGPRAKTAFRNPQVAAPLKPASRRKERGLEQAFRNPQVAAPLKPRENAHRAAYTTSFRNPQVAAPLKRVQLGPERADLLLSATLKLRLH